jgi:hypothetical protein
MKIITLEFKNGVVYSLAVLGYYKNNQEIKIVTYGKHLLITKNINIESLCTYIQGQIDLLDLSLESDSIQGFDNITPMIIFKYREISVQIDNYKNVCTQEGINVLIEKSKTDNIEIPNKILSQKIKTFLNVIPLTSDFSKYGYNLGEKLINGIKGEMYKYTHEISIFIYNKTEYNYSGIIYKNNHEYLTFEDSIIKDILSSSYRAYPLEGEEKYIRVKKSYNLIRTLGKNKVYIKEDKILGRNEIIYVETTLTTKKIVKLKRDLIRDEKYLSFDIECYLDKNNEFKPFSCKWYHFKKEKEYIVTDYDSWENMIHTSIMDLFKYYSNYTIYIHNLSKFDSLFLLKIFYKHFDCKVKFKDNRAIEIKIKTSNNSSNLKLTFKDSLMLIPISLEKAIKAFNLPIKKLAFPYLFVKSLEDLNYSGKIPDYSFYKDQISYEEYIKLTLNYSHGNP